MKTFLSENTNLEFFFAISSSNSLAWNDKEYTYEEILNPSDKNPTLAFPYNKFHCTSWNVNQAAALIICSDEIADILDGQGTQHDLDDIDEGSVGIARPVTDFSE